MPRTPKQRLSMVVLALLSSAIATSGCATWQGPRIDPTGESLLIWPNAPAVATPAAPIISPSPVGAAPVVAVPQTAPAAQPLPTMAPSTPFGNVMAPPVYSDPPGMVPTTPLVVPAAGTPVATTPPPASAAPTLPPVVPPSTPAAPTPSLSPPPGTAPAPVLPTAAPVPYGKDFLTVSPNGLVAPIGSEMLLKAGIIAPDRHLIPYQRIDWSINRTGVGQFTKLGFRDFGQFWGLLEAPQKLDDWSAITSTAVVPITLNTSTHNPNDDVPIYRGESWVTVTSATEGTSLVTAYAPAYSEFNQATSTIYWVDAQWIFPQPAIVEPGRSHTLTTTLMRRSDGAPLAGWIVQYNVSGGALGYEGGSSVDTTTDANGRASVEVNPKDPGGGVTNVGITIVRPQTAGPAVMPRLNLGRSAVTITWAQGGTAVPAPPIVPSIPGGAPITSPPPTTFTPPPALPPTTTQPAPTPTPPSTPAPSTYTPPPAPVGKPQLEATLRTTSTNQVTVGGYARFDLTVTNRGDGVAHHVLITARFDRGLRHPNAKPNEYSVVYTSDDLKELEPNESQSIPLTFQVVDGGTQCTDVTVTADGAEAVSQRGCVTARQAALEVSVTGPRSQVVGDAAKFNVTVRNVSDVAATNIELVIHCDPAILPTMAEKGSQLLADGGILLKIDRLEAAERRTFGMEGQCRTASNKACARATVTADGGVNQAAEACVEILPPLKGGTPGAATPPAAANLRLTVAVTKNPARVGEKQLINVIVENAGQQTETQVSMRVLLPQEFTPDATQIQPQSEATVLGNEIRFATITELAPGQQRQYVIPVTPNRTGRVQVRAEVAAMSLAAPKTADSAAIDITSASP